MFRRNSPASPNFSPSQSDNTSTASSTTARTSAPASESTPVILSATPPSFPPVSKASSAMQAKSPPSAPAHMEVSRRKGEHLSFGGTNEGKTLTVGRDISLSGSINSCERLIVEGSVQADLTDAIILEVAVGGRFQGSVEVDEADIAGTIDGTVLVRKKLTLRSTGMIKGIIRYAKLSVEMGGRIDGTIEPLVVDSTDVPLRAPLIPTYRSE